eukprot:UN07146
MTPESRNSFYNHLDVSQAYINQQKAVASPGLLPSLGELQAAGDNSSNTTNGSTFSNNNNNNNLHTIATIVESPNNNKDNNNNNSTEKYCLFNYCTIIMYSTNIPQKIIIVKVIHIILNQHHPFPIQIFIIPQQIIIIIIIIHKPSKFYIT